jgi:hypothetical protein
MSASFREGLLRLELRVRPDATSGAGMATGPSGEPAVVEVCPVDGRLCCSKTSVIYVRSCDDGRSWSLFVPLIA